MACIAMDEKDQRQRPQDENRREREFYRYYDASRSILSRLLLILPDTLSRSEHGPNQAPGFTTLPTMQTDTTLSPHRIRL